MIAETESVFIAKYVVEAAARSSGQRKPRLKAHWLWKIAFAAAIDIARFAKLKSI